MKNKYYQTGMTLIEIMVALLIGLFLMGGVMEIFINSKQTYRMQENLSRLQENGRFALDFLANDIRMAGFLGCNSQAALTNVLNTPTDFLYNFGTAIEGFESTSASAWTPAINAAITSPLGDSDVITIRRAADQSFTVTTHASGTADLTLDANATTANLKTADFLTSAGANNCVIAVASDCAAATVFQVSAIAGTVLSHTTGSGCSPDNLTNDLGKAYQGGQVYPINTISYYVRTRTGANQPSLYHKVGSNDAEELMEGIEQMHVLYGEDTDMNVATGVSTDYVPNYYVTANSVVNMRRVVSIRISLLAATLDDNLTSESLTYTYNGATVTPTDRKIRRVFNTTIAVRIRLP
jgi:type IV pilus assembly protein PilW